MNFNFKMKAEIEAKVNSLTSKYNEPFPFSYLRRQL